MADRNEYLEDPMWYVVHTYSGYENKVKTNIDKSIQNLHLEDQKTQLSKEIRAIFWGEIKDKLWKDSFWSDSYFITTTGGADIETLEKYIQDQGIEKPKRKYTKRQTKKCEKKTRT